MIIFNYISEITDPRSDINKKHELIDVIFLVFAAVLSGASGWKSIQPEICLRRELKCLRHDQSFC